jgi:hypothetical protein
LARVLTVHIQEHQSRALTSSINRRPQPANIFLGIENRWVEEVTTGRLSATFRAT